MPDTLLKTKINICYSVDIAWNLFEMKHSETTGSEVLQLKQKRIPDGGVPRLSVDCANGSLHKILSHACSFTKGGFSLITQQELEVLNETREEERCEKKKNLPEF